MNNYEIGFITKCAEYGVDPDLLIKYAQEYNPLTGFGGLVVSRTAKGAREGVNKYLEAGNPVYKANPTFKEAITGQGGFIPVAKAGIQGIRDEFSKSPVQQMLDKYDGKVPPKPSMDVSKYRLPEHIGQQAQQARQNPGILNQPRLMSAPSRPRFR